jgi:hypothetical protein
MIVVKVFRDIHGLFMNKVEYKAPYALLAKLSDCTVTSYLTEKLSKLRSFDT